MKIENAKIAGKLASRVDWLHEIIEDMDTVYFKDTDGTFTITIPRKWIPALIKMAEEDITAIKKQIDEL